MAKAADQFEASDVTFWGMAALVCCGLAVLSANVSAAIPPGILGGLHASRLEGGGTNQMRAEIASLQAAAAEMRRENEALRLRFTMAEEARGAVTQRVGALEVSIPSLLEQLTEQGVDTAALTPGRFEPAPTGDTVDTAAVTSSIGDGVETFEADGGTVAFRRVPFEPLAAPPPLDQAMPERVAEATEVGPLLFGIAVGPSVAIDDAAANWERLNAKIGTLLLGLDPLLAEDADPQRRRIVAGPIDDIPQAEALCRRMDLVGIACLPVPYSGDPLSN